MPESTYKKPEKEKKDITNIETPTNQQNGTDQNGNEKEEEKKDENGNEDGQSESIKIQRLDSDIKIEETGIIINNKKKKKKRKTIK